MSLNGPAGGMGNGDSESNANIESLLAQLRRQSAPDSPGPANRTSYSHYQHAAVNQSFYGQQGAADSLSSSFEPDAFPPAAPTPPTHGFQSHQFPPSMTNPTGNARGVSSDDRTSHLLNLLKFSGGSASENPSLPLSAPKDDTPASSHPVIHAPAPAYADPSGLLAALMKGGGLHNDQGAKHEPAVVSASAWNQAAPPSDTQQYLLNLLNRPKPSQNDANIDQAAQQQALSTPQSAREQHEGSLAYKSPATNVAGSPSQASPLPAVPSQGPASKHTGSPQALGSPGRSQPDSTPSKHGLFTYNNPFEDLAATSPLNRTPKSSSTPAGRSDSAAGNKAASSAPMQLLKNPDHATDTPSTSEQKRRGTDRSLLDNPEHTRRKIQQVSSPLSQSRLERTPPTSTSHASVRSSERGRATVAEAVNELAQQADRDARDAIARAEEEEAQSEIAKDLDDMLNAKTDEDFEQSAQIAAKALKKELEKDENKSVLDDAFAPEVAQAVKDIVDETALGAGQAPVVDSWESAEADEIIVIEETPTPVQVFNCPMKPWIALTVLEDAKIIRPLFREDAILDIARLKKDFDQIDRNLVTASENYMAYGMSKNGGLRVIRQEDGKDAKLFTDTRDRIFSVSMSATPADQSVTPKEAMLGTGVSGAVYWVQLKNGEKDHLDDAHPEQYGFALPPITTQDGDAPGGVLKTRARTSSSHPEFFAVGRGKSINIIWPSFVLEKKLFKPGHDRVVDTEKLLKQCSLKINTGKAGKDFTFSQDDSTVVSLDKSGRVKFWDVRDLTAAAPHSDPRNPMPAQTSLEIKEPLMTLTTTPDGEKAWPTSVLLLDKLRPYQKRAALRYMVVGMKQNHTLQLWDLALGKPVQEFNLPHSKESDAVCSVMYHPPTGMIVVGHPTRNSIYFLHLSAPKYTLKHISQVDYIQRLVAQDSSIPQPESTAVISGIREYSFANKGILRSLDILQNPAASAEGDEQALFELYAMHSKGVTCLFVKEGELGWTKDKKVINPVEAVDVGLVKISKLVSPQPSQQVPIQSLEGQGNAPLETALTGLASTTRLAHRTKDKDLLQKTSSSQGEEKKRSDTGTPSKLGERKEEEATAPSAEKSEKKSRKKKSAANASDRELLANSNGAGTSNSQGAQRPFEPAKALTTSSTDTLESIIGTMEYRLGLNLSERIDSALTDLVNQLNEHQSTRESAFTNNQSKLLQMVSSVLNENTEAVLKNIVKEQFDSAIVPLVRETVNKSFKEQVAVKLPTMFSRPLQETLSGLLPKALSSSLVDREVLRNLSSAVESNIVTHVQEMLEHSLKANLLPALSSKITDSTRSIETHVETQLQQHRRSDAAQIEQLTAQTTHLTALVTKMAASHSQMQKDLGVLRQQMLEQREHAASHSYATHPQGGSPAYAQSRGSGGSQQLPIHHQPSRDLVAYEEHRRQASQERLHREPPQPHAAGSHNSRYKLELEQLISTVDQLMDRGEYDEAMMRWLQAGPEREEEVFRQVIVKYNPSFVSELQPLLLLSVGATVSSQLDGPNVAQKLALTEIVIYSFNQIVHNLDEQVREVTPKIMTLLKTRIEHLFLRISRLAPNDPTLKNLTNMANVAGRINDIVTRGGREVQY